MLSLFCWIFSGCEQLAALVAAGGVANHRGAAAHKGDRAMAGFLHPVQDHHGDEVAHMNRWSRAVIAYISSYRLRAKRVCLTLPGLNTDE